MQHMQTACAAKNDGARIGLSDNRAVVLIRLRQKQHGNENKYDKRAYDVEKGARWFIRK